MSDDVYKTVMPLSDKTVLVKYETIRGTSYAWQYVEPDGSRRQKTSSAWREMSDPILEFAERNNYDRGMFP